ncbi:MAG: DNA polymerase III subunit gamma/tau, partial [Nitrospirae bacterium]
MSYLVLARKWRPQGFDDLVGQEPLTRILKNSLSQNKIAHAYIFSGPRGVGKTSSARILAKALNCEKGPTPSPCGICPSCTSIKDGTSVDVLEIDGASNNSVDDIRDLREGVKYTPLGGRYKIYIIDEAHMLSTSAFNALLKTLEEPPPHAVFVLATTGPKKIPATIFSRCQHLPFRRISTQKIKERLKHISSSEALKISDSAIEMVARAADGSMRDSLTILDQLTSFSADINETEVKDLLGIADIGMLSELSSAVIEGDREKIIRVIAELVDRGADLKSFAKDLVEFFRDLLVAKIVKKPEEMLDLDEVEINAIRQILPKVSADLLTLMLSEIVKAESDVRSSFSPRLSLEMSLIRASFLSSLKPVKEAIENIDAIMKG